MPKALWVRYDAEFGILRSKVLIDPPPTDKIGLVNPPAQDDLNKVQWNKINRAHIQNWIGRKTAKQVINVQRSTFNLYVTLSQSSTIHDSIYLSIYINNRVARGNNEE